MAKLKLMRDVLVAYWSCFGDRCRRDGSVREKLHVAGITGSNQSWHFGTSLSRSNFQALSGLTHINSFEAFGEGGINLRKPRVVRIPKHQIETVHAQCGSQLPQSRSLLLCDCESVSKTRPRLRKSC